MKAKSKITGNVLNGKIAEILSRLGKATPIEDEPETEELEQEIKEEPKQKRVYKKKK